MTSCTPALKASSIVACVTRGRLGPAVPEAKSSASHRAALWIFSNSPSSSSVLCFWDLPTALGFEWGWSPSTPSFKFTVTRSLSAPCDLWKLLWLLKFAAEHCNYSRQVIVLQVLAGPLAKE